MKPESRDDARAYDKRPLARAGGLALVLGVATWLLAPLLFPPRLPEDFPKLPDVRTLNPSLRTLLVSADKEARKHPGSAEAMGKLGMVYHSNLFLEQAARAYRIAARLSPGDYQWAYCQAFLREENGDEAEQFQFLEQTLRLKPDHVPALLKLADAAFKRDRLDDAAQYYEKAASVPDSGSSLQAAFGLGRVAARREEWNKVIEYIAPLTRTYPGLQPPYELLQQAYEALGQADKAKEARENIPATKVKAVPPPEDPLNEQLIGLCYSSTRLLKQAGLLSRQGYADRAIEVARRAAEANPTDPDIRYFIARTLVTYHADQPEAMDDALTQLGECLRLKPDDLSPLWRFTFDFFDTPKTPAAIERLSALLRPHADRPEAHFYLGLVAKAKGETGEALSQFQAALKNDPTNAGIYLKIGVILDRAAKVDEAIAYLQKAVNLAPLDTVARFNLGLALLQRGNNGEGLKELNEVLRLKPHDAPTHFVMAFAFVRSKRIEEAIANFRAGLRYQPEDADAHYGLGSAFAMQRKREDAAAEVREALRLRPNYPEAQALLQQLEH